MKNILAWSGWKKDITLLADWVEARRNRSSETYDGVRTRMIFEKINIDPDFAAAKVELVTRGLVPHVRLTPDDDEDDDDDDDDADGETLASTQRRLT